MRHDTERTSVGDLEQTVLLGLKSQPSCLVSAARIDQCLRGLGEPLRDKWREDFCREEGLSAETVARGILFTRLPIPKDGNTGEAAE